MVSAIAKQTMLSAGSWVAGDPRPGRPTAERQENRETLGLSRLTATPCRNAGRKRLGVLAGLRWPAWLVRNAVMAR
jgi:hypothetical protein